MSEVYCVTCSDTHLDSPSCLTTFSKQKASEHSTTLLDVESEIEYSKNFNKKLVMAKPTSPVKKNSTINANVEYEIACEAEDDENDDNVKFAVMTEKEKREMVRVESKEETPTRLNNVKQNPSTSSASSSTSIQSIQGKGYHKSRLDILRRGNGKNKKLNKIISNTVNNNETTSFIEEENSNNSDDNNNSNDDNETDEAKNDEGEKSAVLIKHSSLPMVNKQKHKKTISIPQRVTADGTKIFYLCDLPKKLRKGSHIYYFFHYFFGIFIFENQEFFFVIFHIY